ncbi:MFS transporter [uncultured Enterovirga sp.]|uniref:MFS transporter n=1 Tax=uncultured Enterovirga sp. TaxID=2026352 RepID=UPI0035CC8E72
MASSARRQIVFVNAAHLLTHYSLLILPTAVLVMARPGGAFGPDYGPVLALATGMFVLYGVASLPQGWLAARIGRHALMLAFCFGTGLSLIAAGFAATPLLLALALGSAGLFAAIYHPIGTAMLVEAAGERPGRSIGTNGVFGNFGVALAPVVTAFLAQRYGWQVAFMVPGIVCIGLGLLWIGVPEYDHAAHPSATPFPVIPAPLVRRAVATLLAIAVVSGLVFNAFTLLLPKLMQERLAGDANLIPIVGILAFAVTLCGAATQFTVGRLIDRTTLKRLFLPLALVLAPTLAALSFAQGWLVLPLAGVAAAVIFGQVTVNETMTARYVAPPLRAKLYSVRFFMGFLGSAVAAPLIGFLHERTGSLTSATLVLAGVATVTFLCALFFPDRPEELRPELWAKADPAIAPAE